MADAGDILNRLETVEAAVADVRVRVEVVQATLQSTLPHVATKAEAGEVKASIDEIRSQLPRLATKAELGSLPHLATKAELGKLETAIEKYQAANEASTRKLIMWYVGTQVGMTGLIVATAGLLIKLLSE